RIPDARRLLDDRRLLGHVRVAEFRAADEEGFSGPADRRSPAESSDLSRVLRHRRKDAGAEYRLCVQSRNTDLGTGWLRTLRARYPRRQRTASRIHQPQHGSDGCLRVGGRSAVSAKIFDLFIQDLHERRRLRAEPLRGWPQRGTKSTKTFCDSCAFLWLNPTDGFGRNPQERLGLFLRDGSRRV